jgi:hypothetical protein
MQILGQIWMQFNTLALKSGVTACTAASSQASLREWLLMVVVSLVMEPSFSSGKLTL